MPMRNPCEQEPHRAWAAQLLEMLIDYAWLTEDVFTVSDGGLRSLSVGQVLEECGDRVVRMVTEVDREGAGDHGHPPCSVGGKSCALQPPRYPVG